jgi:hypothetical protein
MMLLGARTPRVTDNFQPFLTCCLYPLLVLLRTSVEPTRSPVHHVLPASLQVHTLCREALMDAPSCPPALDLLSAYYTHVACLAAQQVRHLTRASLGSSGLAAEGAGSSGSAGAGQGVATSTSATEAGAVSQEVKQAQEAVKAAARNALVLLNHLAISDPVRTMYWAHRQQDIEALLLNLGLGLGDLGAPPPPVDVPVAQPAQVAAPAAAAAAAGGQPMVL